MSMIKFAAEELHKAVYYRLKSDTALNEVITGIYDQVSENAVFPYATIGEQTSRAFDTKTSIGENMTLVLNCWSDYSNKGETYRINSLMIQALTKSPLSLEGGFSMVKFERDAGTTVISDPSGLYHGILRLRYYIQN